MAAEHLNSRFKFPWMSAQRIARREPPPAPFQWRETMKSRLLVCGVVFGLWTIGIESRLLYLQVFAHAEMTVRANRQQMRTHELPAKRGEIVDRNGRLLAYSVDANTIGADPSQVVDPEGTGRRLCAALDDCTAEMLRDLVARLKKPKTQFVFVARQVSHETAERVRALELDGIVFYNESRRFYPKRELAAHILGYVGIDSSGLGGIESAYDARVKGRPGQIILGIDSKQRVRDARIERPATAGDSLELTIDQYLQRIAERELRAGVLEHSAQGGTAIVMNPNTGEILALANYPTFNPNAYKDSGEEARRNRATQEVYEPGSTFKLVTASAAMEERVLTMTDLIDCAPGYITFPGRRINDVHTYGVLSFEDVIVKSSNVGAIKAGLKIGAERLGLYINRFGFGQALSPDFRGESSGIVWNPAGLDPSALASVSMGYQIGVTPLQMATAVSSVANGGTLMEPRIVRAFIKDGRREPVAPKALRRTVSEATASTLTTVMESVVERGTATAAKIEGFTVAGKTGTAAKIVNRRYSNSEYNVSFAGFVPSRRPELTIIVVIDSPHGRVTAYGGTVAAPIFQRIAEASLLHLGIGRTINAPTPVMVQRRDGSPSPSPTTDGPSRGDGRIARVAMREGLMPDTLGMSAREASNALSKAGLRPQMSGSGFVVRQTPEPGTPIVRGESAALTLGRRPPVVHAGGAQE